jgi:hypothetical protein
MMKRNFYLLFILVGISCESGTSEEVSYHPNGQVLYKVKLVNGKREGVRVGFYPNGKKHSECDWRDGMLHGKCVYYRNSGEVSAEVNWKENIMVGDHIKYWQNGKIQQATVLDTLGRVTDYAKYDSLGNRVQRKSALFISTSDSVRVGEDYTAFVRLGNRQFSRIEVILGDPNDKEILNLPFLPKRDSVTAILKVKAEKIGTMKIQGIVIEMNAQIDSAITVPFVHRVLVFDK